MLTPRQHVVAVSVVALLVAWVVIAPLITLVAANAVIALVYVACSLYKFGVVYNASGHNLELPVDEHDVAALDDRDLPIYTILVPLYHEAEVVGNLVSAIAALDYPRSKLDIKLIVEEDDAVTRDALDRIGLPAHFKVLIVPDAQPKTKPKACNSGSAGRGPVRRHLRRRRPPRA